MYTEVFDLIDIRDPVVRKVQILEGLLPIKSFDSPDKIVIQIKSLKSLALSWQPLDLLDLIEREDQSVQVDQLF